MDKSYIPVFLIREGIVTLVKPQMINSFPPVRILQQTKQSFPQPEIQQPQQQEQQQNLFPQQTTMVAVSTTGRIEPQSNSQQKQAQYLSSIPIQVPLPIPLNQHLTQLQTQNEVEQILLREQQPSQQQVISLESLQTPEK